MLAQKKPVTIEYVLLLANEKNLKNVQTFLQGSGATYGIGLSNRVEEVNIPTLEGTMTANVGDYIIKGVHGEFYPCKPDIFKETYDLID